MKRQRRVILSAVLTVASQLGFADKIALRSIVSLHCLGVAKQPNKPKKTAIKSAQKIISQKNKFN